MTTLALTVVAIAIFATGVLVGLWLNWPAQDAAVYWREQYQDMLRRHPQTGGGCYATTDRINIVAGETITVTPGENRSAPYDWALDE